MIGGAVGGWVGCLGRWLVGWLVESLYSYAGDVGSRACGRASGRLDAVDYMHRWTTCIAWMRNSVLVIGFRV